MGCITDNENRFSLLIGRLVFCPDMTFVVDLGVGHEGSVSEPSEPQVLHEVSGPGSISELLEPQVLHKVSLVQDQSVNLQSHKNSSPYSESGPCPRSRLPRPTCRECWRSSRGKWKRCRPSVTSSRPRCRSWRRVFSVRENSTSSRSMLCRCSSEVGYVMVQGVRVCVWVDGCLCVCVY